MNDPIPDLPITTARVPAELRLPVLPPVAALIEIAVLFALLLLADWMLPNVELSDIRPHPFWLPVLLLSMQYGTVSGLLAAAVAIGLSAGSGFPEQGPTETYFAYLIKIWVEPILWVGAAVLIGQFRMRQIARKQQLAHQVAELSSQRAAIADYARNLRTHCNALERQIAGRQAPDLLLALHAMEDAHRSGLAQGDTAIDEAFARVMGIAMPAAHATLYSADVTGLRLVAIAGTAAEPPPNWIAPAEPIYQAIAGHGEAVSVMTRDGERHLAGSGIAAVPVTTGGVGGKPQVIGMLKIERIDPALLGPSTLAALAAIGRAFAPALRARTDGHRAIAPAAAAVVAPTGNLQPPRFLRQLRWFRDRLPATAADIPATARPRSTSSVNS